MQKYHFNDDLNSIDKTGINIFISLEEDKYIGVRLNKQNKKKRISIYTKI